MALRNIELLYLGERVDVFGSVGHKFRDAKGETYTFSGGLRGYIFGDSYMGKGSGPGKTTIPVRAVWLGDKQTIQPTDEDRLEYEGAKVGVMFKRREKQKAMELKRPHANIVKAIELLRPFAQRLDNIDLRRLMGYVENQVSKRKQKKR